MQFCAFGSVQTVSEVTHQYYVEISVDLSVELPHFLLELSKGQLA